MACRRAALCPERGFLPRSRGPDCDLQTAFLQLLQTLHCLAALVPPALDLVEGPVRVPSGVWCCSWLSGVLSLLTLGISVLLCRLSATLEVYGDV